MGKEAVIAIGQICQLFFVRAKLNEDHALYLAEVIESGGKLPPIEVAELENDRGDKVIALVDGRHRLHAYETVLDRKSIPVVFVKGSREELLLRAMRANTGGSLSTGGSDINLVIKQLLAMNVPKTRIIQQMSSPNLPFPPSLIRRHLETVANQLTRDKIVAAQHAVAEGNLKVVDAAEKFGIPLNRLQTAIGGGKKKQSNLLEIGNVLEKTARSKSALISRAVMRAIDMFDDGDLKASQVQKILDKIENLNKRSIKMHKDWTQRFEERKKLLKLKMRDV